MKLNSIFERAVRLCGISEEYLHGNDLLSLRARALSAINTTLFDLCGEGAANALSEEADITPAVADAAVYGTAMFISLSHGDTDKSSLFSEIYNAKRAAVKAEVTAVRDLLPKTEAV